MQVDLYNGRKTVMVVVVHVRYADGTTLCD